MALWKRTITGRALAATSLTLALGLFGACADADQLGDANGDHLAGEAGSELDGHFADLAEITNLGAGLNGATCALGIPVGSGLLDGTPRIGQQVRGEGEIVDVLTALNSNEIALSVVALARSRDPGVRAFAEAMLVSHQRAQRMLDRVADSRGIAPVRGAIGTLLEAERSLVARRLFSLRGAEFDRMFMDAQVVAHSQGLYLVRWQLLSALDEASGSNGDGGAAGLRPLLTTMQAETTEHLLAAVELRAGVVADLAGLDLPIARGVDPGLPSGVDPGIAPPAIDPGLGADLGAGIGVGDLPGDAPEGEADEGAPVP